MYPAAEDLVAFFKPLYENAGFLNDTRDIPAEDVGEGEVGVLGHVPFADLPVDRVDPAGIDFDKDFIRPDYWFWCIFVL